MVWNPRTSRNEGPSGTPSNGGGSSPSDEDDDTSGTVTGSGRANLLAKMEAARRAGGGTLGGSTSGGSSVKGYSTGGTQIIVDKDSGKAYVVPQTSSNLRGIEAGRQQTVADRGPTSRKESFSEAAQKRFNITERTTGTGDTETRFTSGGRTVAVSAAGEISAPSSAIIRTENIIGGYSQPKKSITSFETQYDYPYGKERQKTSVSSLQQESYKKKLENVPVINPRLNISEGPGGFVGGVDPAEIVSKVRLERIGTGSIKQAINLGVTDTEFKSLKYIPIEGGYSIDYAMKKFESTKPKGLKGFFSFFTKYGLAVSESKPVYKFKSTAFNVSSALGLGVGRSVEQVKAHPVRTVLIGGAIAGGTIITGGLLAGVTGVSFAGATAFVGTGTLAGFLTYKEVKQPGSVLSPTGALVTIGEVGAFAVPLGFAGKGISKVYGKIKNPQIISLKKENMFTAREDWGTTTLVKTSTIVKIGKQTYNIQGKGVEYAFNNKAGTQNIVGGFKSTYGKFTAYQATKGLRVFQGQDSNTFSTFFTTVNQKQLFFNINKGSTAGYSTTNQKFFIKDMGLRTDLVKSITKTYTEKGSKIISVDRGAVKENLIYNDKYVFAKGGFIEVSNVKLQKNFPSMKEGVVVGSWDKAFDLGVYKQQTTMGSPNLNTGKTINIHAQPSKITQVTTGNIFTAGRSSAKILAKTIFKESTQKTGSVIGVSSGSSLFLMKSTPKTQLKSSVDVIQKPTQRTGLFSGLRTNQTSRSALRTGLNTRLSTGIYSITAQGIIQKSTQKSTQRTTQRQTTVQTPIQEQILVNITGGGGYVPPRIVPTTPTPTPFNIQFKSTDRRKNFVRNMFSLPRRTFKYTSSIVPAQLGIYGKKEKVITGIRRRPLLSI